MTQLATYAAENGVTLDEIADPSSDAKAHATPEQVAELEKLIAEKVINDKIARQVLEAVLADEGNPAEIVDKKGLKVVSDDGALIKAIEEAFAKMPKAKDDIAGGNLGAAGPIIGMVMKATGGQADGARVKELIQQLSTK